VRHHRPTQVVLERTARNPFVRRLPRGVDPEDLPGGVAGAPPSSPPRMKVEVVLPSVAPAPGSHLGLYVAPSTPRRGGGAGAGAGAGGAEPATEPRRKLVMGNVIRVGPCG
jgi:hypothetical protein